METRYEYRPVRFFLLTLVLTWIPWFIAAYCSYRPGLEAYRAPLFFMGGFGPFLSSLLMIWTSRSAALKRDFLDRLTNIRRPPRPYVAMAAVLFPAMAFASVFISITLGGSPRQLELVSNWASWLPLMFLAPVCEEIGWRGYGMDALRSRVGLTGATVAFAFLWMIWHAPLFIINHTYQHDVLLAGPAYVANFAIGMLPTALLFTWIYYRTNRSILALIIFHLSANVIPELFNIAQDTKLWVSLPLHFAAAALIVCLDRKLFREGPRNFLHLPASVEKRSEHGRRSDADRRAVAARRGGL